ncbi:MAG TPA: TasA family protein [Solirubrobacteraceae bacterium]
MRLTSIRARVLATGTVVGAAAAIAGLGTFGTFTSSTTATQSVSAGTVAIGLGTAGTATNRLTIGASNIVPGDTIQRQVQLTDSGTANLASIGLTTTASPSSLLDTDATNGLQMTVQSCSVAWTEAGTAPAYTYTCSGTTTSVLASRAVIGANINLPGLNSLTAAGVDHLLVTLTFPSTAPNTMQNQSSTITYTFLGTQRAGTNQ